MSALEIPGEDWREHDAEGTIYSDGRRTLNARLNLAPLDLNPADPDHARLRQLLREAAETRQPIRLQIVLNVLGYDPKHRVVDDTLELKGTTFVAVIERLAL